MISSTWAATSSPCGKRSPWSNGQRNRPTIPRKCETKNGRRCPAARAGASTAGNPASRSWTSIPGRASTPRLWTHSRCSRSNTGRCRRPTRSRLPLADPINTTAGRSNAAQASSLPASTPGERAATLSPRAPRATRWSDSRPPCRCPGGWWIWWASPRQRRSGLRWPPTSRWTPIPPSGLPRSSSSTPTRRSGGCMGMTTPTAWPAGCATTGSPRTWLSSSCSSIGIPPAPPYGLWRSWPERSPTPIRTPGAASGA